MNWIVGNVKWLMLVAGALTCTMLYAAISPRAALQSNFGATLEGPVADIVVANWGALIALIGGMLIYGAFHAPVRSLVISVAVISKLVFIGLVLSHGSMFLGYQAGVAVVADSVMVLLFLAYLLSARGKRPAA